jgi:hypothetical protein
MTEQNFTNNSQLAIQAVYGRKMITEKADNNIGYELTSCMTLSNVAKKELMEVLLKEFGPEKAKEFSDKDLNTIGLLLLNILAESLKMKIVK